MGCSPAKSLGTVGKIHILLGVLSIVFGIVALEVAPYNTNGVFGMGIWLGGWMLITGVVGLMSAYNPKNFCKLGGFIGCCLVGLVSMAVCSVILGVAVLKHFAFESSVTREYYKEYDYAKYTHEDYYKPQEYFDQRNKEGRIGCGIYGSLLSIMIFDVLTSLVSCYIGRSVINKEHVNITSSSQSQQRRPLGQIPDSTGIRGRVFIINQSPTVVTGIPPQEGFVAAPYYSGPKLPNYLDIYPEGSPTWQSPETEVVQPMTPTVLLGPPPAYTPTATDSTTGEDESQMTPVENQTTHSENETTPENQTTPEENQTAPEENQTTPEENQTTHSENETTPEENQTAPEENQTTPEENQTTPEENQTTHSENETTPEENQTAPEENQTTPEENQTTGSRYLIV